MRALALTLAPILIPSDAFPGRPAVQKAAGRWVATQAAKVELLAGGRLTLRGTAAFSEDEIGGRFPLDLDGHYEWTQLVAVTP